MDNDFSRRTFLKTTALVAGAAAVRDVPARAQQSVGSEAQRDPTSRQQERGIRLRTVGIMSPGDMGSAVGQVLARHGLTVVAALGERSARTRALAAEAGINDVGTLENLVRKADVVMSILDPDAAIGAAQRVAEAMKSAGAKPLYADCNSIAVQSARKIGEIMKAVGAPLQKPRSSVRRRACRTGPASMPRALTRRILRA